MIADGPVLLAPIPGDAPAGRDLRYDGVLEDLRRLRHGDDARLPQGVWQHATHRVDWPAVVAACSEVLTASAKDLQIAVWLVDAEVRHGSLAALPAAVDWLTAFVACWWADAFPRPDEDGDASARVSALFWLDRELALQVRTARLTAPTAGGDGLSWTDLANARRLDLLRVQDRVSFDKAERGGAITLAQVDDAFTRTGVEMLRATAASLTAAGHALDGLIAAVDAATPDGPAFAELRTALREVADALGPRLPRAHTEASPHPAAQRRPPPRAPETPAAIDPGVRLAFTNREDAYATLAAVADYLAEVEPHSPTPYLLARALAWRDLRLDQVMADLGGGDASARLLWALLEPGHDGVSDDEDTPPWTRGL